MQVDKRYIPRKYGTSISNIDINNLMFASKADKNKFQIVACDFETTTKPGVENKVYLFTIVWKDKDPVNHGLFSKKLLKREFGDRILIEPYKEGTTIIYGTNVEDFVDIINTTKSRKAVFYFHNGAKFDGTYIFRDLTQRYEFRQDLRVLETFDKEAYNAAYELCLRQMTKHQLKRLENLSPEEEPTYLNKFWQGQKYFNEKSFTTLIKDNAYYEFKFHDTKIWDSSKLFAMRIKDMGDTLNKQYNTNVYSKYEAENEYKQYERFNNLDEALGDANNKDYVGQDSFILWKFLTEMTNKIPKYLWKMTAASTAYTACMDVFAETRLNELMKKGIIRKAISKKTKSPIFFDEDDYLIGGLKDCRNYIINEYLPTNWLQNREGDKTWEKKSEKEYNLSVYTILNQAYKGGLTFVNAMYQGQALRKVLGIDINSSYSSVMNSELPCPYGDPVKPELGSFHIYKLTIKNKVTNEKGLPFLSTSPGFESADYPKDLQPNQEFYICTPELERFKKHYKAKDADYSLEIISSFKTKPMNFFFGEYIAYFYQIKAMASLDKDEALKIAAKLFLNSPYGKFGSKREIELAWFADSWEKVDTIVDDMGTRYYLPIGIAITAYARMKLVDAVGSHFDKVAGGDTDSIYFTYPESIETKEQAVSWVEQIINAKIDSYYLGAWDMEKFNFWGVFRGPKRNVLQNWDTGKIKWTLAGYNNLDEGYNITKDKKGYIISNRTKVKLKISHMLTGFAREQLRPNKKYGGVSLLENYDKILKPIHTDKSKKDSIYWLKEDKRELDKQLEIIAQYELEMEQKLNENQV